MSRLLAAQRALTVPGWVKDELWRRARATPSLDLRFADSKSLVDATTGQNLVTFTRASEATFVNSQGQIQTAAIDAPRFDHNPTTGESLGLLVEESRQNLLLNSGTLSTQNVTVTAVAHTLSFTGTGTITLSGTSTAGPLVGTGTGEANRVSLTFTPTAGTLTLTVSGTVTNAQLEIGAFRTSYIPTAGTAATRSADVATITGTNFSSWFRQDESTAFVDYALIAGSAVTTTSTRTVLDITDGTVSNRLAVRGILNAVITDQVTVRSGGGTAFNLTTGVTVSSAPRKIAAAFRANNTAAAGTGASDVAAADTGPMPIGVNQANIGSIVVLTNQNTLSGTIARLTYWPARLGNEVLQRITQ